MKTRAVCIIVFAIAAFIALTYDAATASPDDLSVKTYRNPIINRIGPADPAVIR